MPIHNGVFQGTQASIDNPTKATEGIQPSVFSGFDTEQVVGNHITVEPIPPLNTHEGILDVTTTAPAQLLDRIYFFPIDINLEHRIDLGIITSNVVTPFQIWNAFRGPSQSITLITSTNPTGTSLQVPVVPWSLNGFEKEEYTATVLLVGPPNQDTSYFFTIAGNIFELQINAERFVALDTVFNPNWKVPTKFSFEFQTVIFRNRVTKEQRRPLYEDPKLIQGAAFLVDVNLFEDAHNILKRAHDKAFFIPFYHEVLKPLNNPLQGETIIDIEEDINFYWNLRNNASFMQIQSVFDPTLNELVSIDSLNLIANQINLVSPIASVFVTKQTIIMPVYPARITSFKPNYKTDKVAEFTLNMEKIRSGS